MRFDQHKKTGTAAGNKGIVAKDVIMFLKIRKGREMLSYASFGINMFIKSKAIKNWQKDMDYPKELSEGNSTR